ncbi:MAG: hypothetical protein GY855_14530 [candidate division Zixibacteria bacterium]|nr:hypothetical protein [candidate division Zixibacteria bacterium]
MSDMHLTTEQIQSYLDGNLDCDRSVIEEHLGVCQHCRMELKRFEKLYSALSKDNGFELNPGFAQNVISHVSMIEEADKKSWYVDAIIPVIGAVASMAVIYYFIGLDLLKSSFINYLKPQWLFFNGLYQDLMGSVSSWGVEQKYILPVVMVIVLTALADYLIKNRHKLISPSQNRMFV